MNPPPPKPDFHDLQWTKQSTAGLPRYRAEFRPGEFVEVTLPGHPTAQILGAKQGGKWRNIGTAHSFEEIAALYDTIP